MGKKYDIYGFIYPTITNTKLVYYKKHKSCFFKTDEFLYFINDYLFLDNYYCLKYSVNNSKDKEEILESKT